MVGGLLRQLFPSRRDLFILSCAFVKMIGKYLASLFSENVLVSRVILPILLREVSHFKAEQSFPIKKYAAAL